MHKCYETAQLPDELLDDEPDICFERRGQLWLAHPQHDAAYEWLQGEARGLWLGDVLVVEPGTVCRLVLEIVAIEFTIGLAG